MKKYLHLINTHAPIVLGIVWFIISINLIEVGGLSGFMLIFPHFWGIFLGPIITYRAMKKLGYIGKKK